MAVEQASLQVASDNKPSASAIAPRRLTTAVEPESPHAINQPPIGTISDHLGGLPSAKLAIRPDRLAGRRAWNPWVRNAVVMLLAIGSIATLFAIIMLLNQTGNSAATSNGLLTEKPESDIGSDLDPGLPDAVSPAGKQREAPVDESPHYFAAGRWKSVWKKINPYLVRLRVQSPLEDRVVTGLLVDSRGWVVTSYRGIKDAGRVRVTIAANDLDSDSPFREMTDDARGIIAIDADRDLAMIAINRAQVLNLADIEIISKDRMVTSQRCLIARVPPPRHRKWLTECRIAGRATFDQLSDVEQSRVEKNEMNVDATLEWIIHPADQLGKQSDEIIGSPIFNEQGQLIAFNSALTISGNLMALPAKHVRQFVESISDASPGPFPNAGQLNTMTSNAADAGEAQPSREATSTLVKQLKRSFEKCRDTGWAADTAEEYKEFQNLAESWITLHEMSKGYAPGSDESGQVEAELQTFMELISVSLVDDVDETEIARGLGNQWFASNVNRLNPWFIIIADISSGVASSPQIGQQPTIGLRLIGSDLDVLSPYVEDFKNLKPGKRFMMFGQLDPRSTIGGNLLDNKRTRIININAYVEMPK